jgi:plastocyanin
MQFNTYPYTLTHRLTRQRSSGTLISVALALVVVITAISLFFSPIGRRWQARQIPILPVNDVNEIDIRADDTLNHVFAPAATQVQAGTTVTWHFKDIDEDGQRVGHNVVFDDNASPVLTDGTFSRTFENPGVYLYRCSLHAYMEGQVIVTD